MAEPPEPTPTRPSSPPSSSPSSDLDEPRLLNVELSVTTMVTVLASISVLLLLVALVRQAPDALTLIAIGAFAGLALDPLVTLGERRLHLPRGWSAAMVLLVLSVVTVIFLAVVGPQLAKQTTELPNQLPDVVQSLTELPLIGNTLAENDVPAKVEDWLGTLPERLAGPSSNLASVVESIGSGMIQAALALAVTVSLVLDGPMLISRVRALIPLENRPRADQIGAVAYAVIARYFVGNLFLSVLHGVWVAIWGTALGVPLTPVLAVWAAITSLIPQIGGLLGFVLIVAVSLTQGIGIAIVMGVSFAAYMTFDNNVLLPIFVGRAIDVSAPVTMLGAIAGFAVAGVAGSLLAIPIIGAGKAIALVIRDGAPPPPPPSPHLPRSLSQRWRRRRQGASPDPAVDA